jgi:hypothetical protein
VIRELFTALSLAATAITPADYQICVTVNPGPLVTSPKPVLYPDNSTLASWGYGTPHFDGWPPKRFRGDNSAKVDFVNPSRINEACGTKPDPNYPEEACQDGDHFVLPNPCTFPRSDFYAQVACHELGHENGWPGNHPL